MKVSMQIAAIAIPTLAGIPGIASAQSGPGETLDTGSLIKRGNPAEIRGESTTAARLTLKEFGMCTVQRRPARALAVIDLPVDTAEASRAIRGLASEDCLADGELRMSQSLLRGAIFEALYLREFGRDAKFNLQKAPAFDYAAGYSRPLSPQAIQSVGLAIVGDCVARTAHGAARELIASIPGSALEGSAIAVVARHLPGCVPPRQTFRFSRTIIRSSMAEALYRLSTTARRTAGASR